MERALDVLVLPVELHLRPATAGAPQEELVAREHRGLQRVHVSDLTKQQRSVSHGQFHTISFPRPQRDRTPQQREAS